MRIPKPRDIWNSSVFLLYREYGKGSLMYALSASLIGVLSAAISQVQQVSFGLIIETLGGDEETSAFPFADLILPSGQQERLVFLIVLVGIVYIYTNISGIVSSYLWSKFKQDFINKIRVATYSATQRLSPDKFVQRGTGEYTSLVINDTRQLGRLPRSVLSGGLNNIVKVSTMGVILITLNWQFALVTLFMVPVILWWTPKYGDLVKELYKEERESQSNVTGRITSSIEGVFTVKSYAAEERELEKVESESVDLKDTVVENSLKRSIYSQVFSISTQLTTFVVVALGAIWVLNGPPLIFTEELTLGEWTVFYTNSTLLMSPASQIQRYVSGYNRSKASADRIYALIDSGRADSEEHLPSVDDVSGKLSYENAEFAYEFEDESPLAYAEDDDKDEEEDDSSTFTFGPVSCEINNGETIGIVGKTGSGKSTFIKHAIDFLEADEGEVLVDGKPLSEHNSRSVREHIGYVSQDPYLFNSTIRDNIMYGNPDATEEDIKKAVESASLDDVIDEFEDGLDADVGKDGSRLSGGQKQRVALARALVSEPEILILDEATSHVDNITENKIKKAIHSAKSNRTTLIIAHRLSTVTDADRIFVMEGGVIAERGTHEELVDRDGIYSELWDKHIGNDY